MHVQHLQEEVKAEYKITEICNKQKYDKVEMHQMLPSHDKKISMLRARMDS